MCKVTTMHAISAECMEMTSQCHVAVTSLSWVLGQNVTALVIGTRQFAAWSQGRIIQKEGISDSTEKGVVC